jgi:hypothetical protein
MTRIAEWRVSSTTSSVCPIHVSCSTQDQLQNSTPAVGRVYGATDIPTVVRRAKPAPFRDCSAKSVPKTWRHLSIKRPIRLLPSPDRARR